MLESARKDFKELLKNAQGFKEKHEHNGERIGRYKKKNQMECLELTMLYLKIEFHWRGFTENESLLKKRSLN